MVTDSRNRLLRLFLARGGICVNRIRRSRSGAQWGSISMTCITLRLRGDQTISHKDYYTITYSPCTGGDGQGASIGQIQKRAQQEFRNMLSHTPKGWLKIGYEAPAVPRMASATSLLFWSTCSLCLGYIPITTASVGLT